MLTAVKELDYQPHLWARGLVQGRTLLIATLLPNIADEFFGVLARAIVDTAFQSGYGVLIYNTEWEAGREREALAQLRRRQLCRCIPPFPQVARAPPSPRAPIAPTNAAAHAARAREVSASTSASSAAYRSSVSRYTLVMDDPGKMSWNWYRSTSFQIRSRASAGYGWPATSIAWTHASSHSRRAISILRLYHLLRPWVV